MLPDDGVFLVFARPHAASIPGHDPDHRSGGRVHHQRSGRAGQCLPFRMRLPIPGRARLVQPERCAAAKFGVARNRGWSCWSVGLTWIRRLSARPESFQAGADGVRLMQSDLDQQLRNDIAKDKNGHAVATVAYRPFRPAVRNRHTPARRNEARFADLARDQLSRRMGRSVAQVADREGAADLARRGIQIALQHAGTDGEIHAHSESGRHEFLVSRRARQAPLQLLAATFWSMPTATSMDASTRCTASPGANMCR